MIQPVRLEGISYGWARQVCLAAGASRLIGGCTSPCTPPEPAPSPTDHSASVAVVRGTNLADMAREALAAFGGAVAVVSPGATVFIKPNFGSLGMVKYNPIAVGESVKPEIVIAVAEECLKADASMVTIGEGGQVPSWDWATVPTLDGTTTMADEAERLRQTHGNRIRLVCLNAETPEWDRVPSSTYRRQSSWPCRTTLS